MSYVKNYNVGQIQLDLPTSNYIHEFPLLSFADIHGNVNLSLVFNYGLRAESSNPFNIAAGYKLNMQKRIVMRNSAPTAFQSESGKVVALNSADTRYAFDDDTQRIIRRTGSTYELENPDFSKECYDQVGKITKAYDKYGVLVLSYAYDSGGKLTSITYRSEKTISFTYNSSNRLNKVTYAGKNISLAYTTSGITLTHYTGVTFTLTSSGMNFNATASATENSTSVSYATKITKNSDYILAISNLVDGSTVNTTTYKFPDIVTSYNTNFSQVEITDHYGVRKRIQFKEDKPLYSYEIGSSDAEFNNDKYAGNVQIHNIFNNKSCFNSGGSQGLHDGCSLTKTDASTEVSWGASLSSSEEYKGFYILSGWLKLPDVNYSSDYIPLNIAKNINSLKYEFRLPKPPVGQWSYFYVAFPYDESSISAFIKKYHGNIETKDFRLSFQTTHVLTDDDTTYVPVTEDVLIYHGETTPSYIHINSSTFACSSLVISNYGKVYYEDILKYKINQRKNRNLTEFYHDKVRTVLTTSASAEVTVTYNGNTYNLSDCYLGKRSYTKNGIITTRLRDDDYSAFLVTETLDANDNVVSSQTIDNNFDVVSVVSDGITTSYTRDNDLIISEKLGYLYTRTTTYSEDAEGNPTITAKDEFYNKTVFTLDPVWGVVKSTVLPDGTVITDEYDSDMCTLVARTFTDSDGNSKTHTFEYAAGNLEELTDGAINYNFTYSAGALSEVFKFDTTPIEKHVFSNGDKTITSYYPKESGALYSIVQNTDKYGRITSINGLLENTYKVVADDGTYNTITPEVNNSSSKLTVSKDLTNGNETRYAYENRNIKKVGVFNSSGTKVNEEELTYDAAGRITKDTFTYNSMSNSVQSDITYATEADSPTADSRVSACSYKVNGTEKAKTQNRYNDNYKRLTAKLVTMGSYTYDKGLTYSKTRISKVMDVKNGSTFHNVSYGYDAMGRIVSESDSTDTSFNNTYVYDAFGRLIQENNKALDKTFVFKYDDNGNIIGCDTIAYTTENVSNDNVTETHVYDSTIKDRLVKFNNISISYDANGCPTYYNGRNYTWTKGKLTRVHCGAAQQPGSLYADCKFTYDAYGRRLSKSYTYDPNPASTSDYSYTYNTTYYYDNSGRLVREYCIEKYISGTTNTRDITYLYDESSIIGAVQTYNGTTGTFYFDRNVKGDVIGIFNSSGTKVASYVYDAWGNCTTRTIVVNNFSSYNPIRYKGYYYDRETGWFWLSSRYYSPELCRFISPDSVDYLDPSAINGLNLYAYCGNDPINRYDPSGHFWDYVFDAAFIAWGIYDLVNGGYKDWKNWVALGVDIVFAVLPFVPSGAGQVIKVGNKIDNAVDVASAINKIDNIQDMSKVTMIGRSMDRVTDTATLIGKADNLYDAWKGYDATATGLKRVAHNGISMLHDAGWMFGKLRSGYTVIDIGMTTLHRGRGLYYGAERFVIGLWKTRNLWKLPINYYFQEENKWISKKSLLFWLKSII